MVRFANERTSGPEAATSAAVAVHRLQSLVLTTRSPLSWHVASHQEISRCIGTGSEPVRSTDSDRALNAPARRASAGSNTVPVNAAGMPSASAALRS
jgi:hypothetical protein